MGWSTLSHRGAGRAEGVIMKRLCQCLLVFVLTPAVSIWAQQGKGSSDPFNGTWRLNVEKTKQLSGGPSPSDEVITIRVDDDNVQHYQVEIQSGPNDPKRKGWYDSKYNDFKFVPY